MTNASALQPSFGGGEYDPALWGRQDLGRYGISGRVVSNWIVLPTGGMERRPGTVFCGAVEDSTRPTRYLPFQVTAELSYLVVANGGVFQFVYRGAFLEVEGVRVEVAHPYADDELQELKITQSVDTMFISHNSHQTRLLRRTGADAFALSLHVAREGPFRPLNSNESYKMAASVTRGDGLLTTNFDFFTDEMVGTLVYLEPESLGGVKPWIQGERTPSLAVGALRISDGKVYRAATVNKPGGTDDYCETGNVRPVHEDGFAWDGPNDLRKIGSGSSAINYRVGVEWEYMHSGYGVAEITGYNNAREVTMTVRRVLPESVVGGFGSPINTWTFSGNDTIGPYSITGASNESSKAYIVTIDGVPVQSSPDYTPPGGTGGGGTGGSGEYDEIPDV